MQLFKKETKPDTQTKKILVIEDNEADFFVLSSYFKKIESSSYDLSWANSTEQALDYLRNEFFDLCLLDYSISPSETGVEFARKTNFRKYDVPCILLTGFDNLDMNEVGNDTFIYDYLLKEELNPSLLNRSLIYALQRKQAEQELITAKQYTSHIIGSIPMMIIQTDENGKIRQVNPAASMITGFSEEELFNKHILEIVSSADYEKAKNYAKAPTGVAGAIRIVTKANEERIISWNTFPFDDSHTIVIGKDVTLETLEKENEQQRQKMEALGQLAGGVAHEVNNLLQPILLLGELSRDELQDVALSENIDSIEENLSIIIENAAKASEIVKDILSFARQEKDETEQICISESLQDGVKFAKELLPKKLKINSCLSNNFSGYISNLGKNDMIKVFSNLLINAAHASDSNGEVWIKGSITEVKNKEAGTLKVSPGTYALITVKDDGCGMDEQTISKIFNPFFTTREIGEGTGLGLSIVYSIIQKNGGTINVDSKVNMGTTFKIFIPVYK